MPVSSTPTKRVALAPISVNINSPLVKRQKLFGPGSFPLTPSLTPKLSLVKSNSVIVPLTTSLAPRQLESFSDYKITNSRNVKADLAATKLKLRLQLAFYKLKQKRDNMVALCPPIRVTKTTVPKPRTFHGSANVNLQRPKVTKGPSLSSVAAQKTGASSSGNLRLYHIKQLSSFHNVSSQRLPLSAQRLPPVHKILKTPIKTTTRTLMYNSMNANSSLGNSNSDETIDETADETAVDLRKRDDMLGSSPLRCNSFGTPNSFSVAKSLLQLGLGYY